MMNNVTELQTKLSDVAIWITEYFLDHDEKLTDGDMRELEGLQELCGVMLSVNKK